MSLADAVIGLRSYGEVKQRGQKLWNDINLAIFSRRMDITNDTLPGISTTEVGDSTQQH